MISFITCSFGVVSKKPSSCPRSSRLWYTLSTKLCFHCTPQTLISCFHFHLVLDICLIFYWAPSLNHMLFLSVLFNLQEFLDFPAVFLLLVSRLRTCMISIIYICKVCFVAQNVVNLDEWWCHMSLRRQCILLLLDKVVYKCQSYLVDWWHYWIQPYLYWFSTFWICPFLIKGCWSLQHNSKFIEFSWSSISFCLTYFDTVVKWIHFTL